MKLENDKLCKECGGKCCKSTSCLYGPEDFKEISVEYFLRLYNEGKIMFSQVPKEHAGNSNSNWLVKPAQIDTPRIQPNIFIGNSPCINLTESGCNKDFYHRPRGGKMLEPKIDSFFGIEDCKLYYTVEHALLAWQPFSEILESAVEHILSEERRQKQEFSYDHDICKMCGGKCCKANGCSFAPGDFKEISFEYLKKIISKGFISIIIIPDVQTGLEEETLVLKVRNKGSKVCDLEVNIPRQCILLEETGCFFEDSDRPYGGRALVPRIPGIGCKKGYSYRQCAIDWKPYQAVLKELYKYFAVKDVVFSGMI